jgi:hypothetical protein
MTISEQKIKRARTSFWVAALFFIAAVLVSWYSLTDNGPHGGALKKSGDYYIEMKNPEGYFFAYLLDKKLKTISDKNLSADVRFFMPDSTVVDVKLARGSDKSYTAKSIPGFIACKIIFKAGKSEISATFENGDKVAELKNP